MVELLKKDNFDDKIRGKALIKFSARWCGSCTMMTPLFSELSRELKGKADFFRVNFDDDNEIAERYSVENVPCIILLEDGVEKGRITGFQTKESLRNKIEGIIK
ncbi:thioredoxin [Candidatus Woesearchaeota archaeon]|nr:thioredoxin [Candidatus Woesearchaeota archaeon]